MPFVDVIREKTSQALGTRKMHFDEQPKHSLNVRNIVPFHSFIKR
jgi:hypothetical protein